MKKSPESIKEHFSSILNGLIRNMEECLKKPSISNKTFLKYIESIFRCFSVVLENFKGRNAYISDISVKGFIYVVKLLFIGTIFQDKILQTLIVHNPDSQILPKSLFTKPEEEGKDELSNYSDNDSNVGSTYTDSLSQDILIKAKASAWSWLKSIFKFGSKTLFNYRYWIVPSFVTDPAKEFLKYHKGITSEEEWEEFLKTVDEYIYKEPSFLYLYLTETDSTFKMNLISWIGAFLGYSPIEKWQGPLERDELSGQYQGLKYDLLESKLQKIGGFIPLSQQIAHFVRYLHYVMIYLIKKNPEDQILATLLKSFSILVEVTPYRKMNDDLLSWCMIPHITTMLREMIDEEESKMNENVQKNLLLWFSSGAQLLCPLMINQKDNEEDQIFFESDHNVIQWLMTDLHESKAKKSFEAIETLKSIWKPFPLIFTKYWSNFKEYINIVFSINEPKRTISTLQLLESWLLGINSLIYSSQKEGSEEEKSLKDDLKELNEEDIDSVDILTLEGWQKLLNKYLMFFIKSENIDVRTAAVGVLCVLSEQQWARIFDAKERTKIVDCVVDSKIFKVEWVKFIGQVFLIKWFYEDFSDIEKMINKIYMLRGDKSIQLSLRSSWAIGNLCETSSIEFLNQEYIAKVLALSLQFSLPDYKDKIVSHSVRAIGYIFANCKDFSKLEQNEVLEVDKLFKIVIENIGNKSPRVSWNSCVLLRSILNNK
jgi:hypothetical protein